VTFEVNKGEVAGFLGLNGAGKTTTMRIISSFAPPTSGAVLVDGHDTVRQSDLVRRVIGYLPERVPLYDDLRVEEYLRYRCRLKGVSAGDTRDSVERVVDRCGLALKRKSIIGTLSKGYRQRVGLADALVHRPRLLILDEPTSGLDPDQRMEIRRLIRELGAECTVLLSTHILPEAEAVCDKVIIIHGGRIRASDSLENMRRGLRCVTVRYSGEALSGGREIALTEGAYETVTEVDLPDVEEANLLVAEVVNQGRKILEVSSPDPTLETIFMRITTGKGVA
jgi:ABC-2 type transport system ATP-binding protein